MKRVLALVLAVMLVSTIALAADIVPGKKIKISRSGTGDDNYTVTNLDSQFVETTSSNKELVKDINTENYSVTSIKYNEGKSYIESIKIDDEEDELVIKMKADYTNTKDRTFDVEFTLNGKGKYYDAAGDRKSVPDVDFRVNATVGYSKVYVALDDTDSEVDLDQDMDGNVIDLATDVVEFENNGAAYAPMIYDIADGEVTVEVRVYDGNKFYLGYNQDADSTILKAYADTDAELNFYEFEGEPTFDATATVYFNDADESYYVYEIQDGKLVKAGSYSEDDGCWVLKARTLGAYVVSDQKLSASSSGDVEVDEDGSDVDNPDTGANDVVGIAAALAAVCLVSAAAVSLKK